METRSVAPTLRQALDAVADELWDGRRGYRSNTCQGTQAITTIATILKGTPETILVSAVVVENVRAAVTLWQAAKFSPETINKRVGVLGAMGIPTKYRGADGLTVRSCRVRRIKAQKWWLNSADEKTLLVWLAGRVASGEVHLRHVIYYLMWATRTGLRVEETLRLRREHFADLWGSEPSVSVPGTKNAESGNVTLELSQEAARVAQEAFGRDARASQRMVPLTYHQLWGIWQQCREHLGLEDNPLATLRACRRSAARALHVEKGMPLDMVRQYLRHSDIQTTMGYLRLTGGYRKEEYQRWLNQ